MENKTANLYLERKYKPVVQNIVYTYFNNIDRRVLDEAIQYSINKRLKNSSASIYNNYKMTHPNQSVKTSTMELLHFIETKEPIISTYGVLFSRHGYTLNFMSLLMDKFLSERKVFKNKRKKHPKGTREFSYYDLLQLLSKVDANSLYGGSGMCKSIFYNLHAAASITSTGQSLISASGLFFEMFLQNNVKFESLEEVITMINHIISEKPKRMFNDRDILDRNITVDECFEKLLMTTGFDWIPNEREMQFIYNFINRLDQEDINRIYYKNNLYDFIDNSLVTNLLKEIFTTMVDPMIFSTDPPENVKPLLDEFRGLVKEYVYYGYQIRNRLDKYSHMIRSVAIITDTDSVIVSLDYWYNYVLDIIKDIPVPLRYTGEESTSENDLIPAKEKLRYSILNTMAYCLDVFINDYNADFVRRANASFPNADEIQIPREHARYLKPDEECIMKLKNEFLFKRLLVRPMKKNYASIQELQEGTIVPPERSLDIKGLPLAKSDVSAETRDRLCSILKDYILDIDSDKFSQVEVIKQLEKFSNEIRESLQSGDTKYYKPNNIKPESSYDNPLGIPGIKGSVVYNTIRDENAEPIDLNIQNKVYIVKVNINSKNIQILNDLGLHKEYKELSKLLNMKEFKSGINSISLPEDGVLPQWVLDHFIDYNTIISNNISKFPLYEIGISRGRKANAYTNILTF